MKIMKNQKGFAYWVVVILISVIAVGLVGAAWYYGQNKDEATTTTINTNTLNTNTSEFTNTITDIRLCVAIANCCNCGWVCREEINGETEYLICPASSSGCPEERYCTTEELEKVEKPTCGFIDGECVEVEIE